MAFRIAMLGVVLAVATSFATAADPVSVGTGPVELEPIIKSVVTAPTTRSEAVPLLAPSVSPVVPKVSPASITMPLVDVGPAVRAAAQNPPVPPGEMPGAKPDDPFREPPISPFYPRRAPETGDTLPDGSNVLLPPTAPQTVTFGPRYGTQLDYRSDVLDDKTRRVVFVGGVIVKVVYQTEVTAPNGAKVPKFEEVEMMTDEAVAWLRGSKVRGPGGGSGSIEPEGEDDKTEVEIYMRGNVVIRVLQEQSQGPGRPPQLFRQTLRACEIWYDVNKSRALAMNGAMEMQVTGFREDIRMCGSEIQQLGKNEFRAYDVAVSSSKRPSDPGIKLTARDSELVMRQAVKTNIFGIPYRDLRTGETEVGYERILTNRNVFLRVFDTPIFYLPRTKTDLAEPAGALAGFSFGSDNVFGTQAYFTWDIYKLIALRPPSGHRWLLHTDYLNKRGPALGTDYDYSGSNLFGFGQQHAGFVRLYGINDKGDDILGGDRGFEPTKPKFRGRMQWRHSQDWYEDGLTYVRAHGQAEYFSDKNFFEQYYKQEFDNQPNQETFLHVYGASGNAGGSLLTQVNTGRNWITETQWWPRADGYLIGESLLDRFTYSARASAGAAGLHPATVTPQPIGLTDHYADPTRIGSTVNTGRFDLMQKIDAPFDFGPVRFDPYGVVDLTYYTDDLTGESRGRFYGGGGLRSALTFSRLYRETTSEIFNLDGLYHKATYSGNYFNGYSDTSHYRLPQLDRLSDDSADLNLRTTRQAMIAARGAGGSLINPLTDAAIIGNPLFDPQVYANRRLVDNRVDTLDSMQVIQLASHQRLQTKRGFPGAEHVVDWMTLDVGMSVFPSKDRDNFGKVTGLYEYQYRWYIGDRTAVTSAGWYDPQDSISPWYTNVGLAFNRPDGTYFSLTYRVTDPLQSRAVTGNLIYNLTRKYAVNVSSSYDLGLTKVQSTTVGFSRVGTDTTMLVGFSYNAIVNNFGFQFAVVPNLSGLTPGRIPTGFARQ